jgi:hypothetical protein
MKLEALGKAMNLAAVPLGCALRFEFNEEIVTGIKIELNGTGTAVIVHGVDAQQRFRAIPANYFDSAPEVFAMRDHIYFAPSPDRDDLIVGQGTNYDLGHLFMYEHEGAFLAVSAGRGSSMLLNVETGATVSIGTYPSSPIEITRWAFVAKLFDKPITLFTYPDDPARPLKFD